MNLLPVLAAPTAISEVSNVPSLPSSEGDKDLETIKEKKDSVLREGQLVLGPNEYAAYQDSLSDFAELCCGVIKEMKRLEFSPVEIDLVVQRCLKDITKDSFQFKKELLEYQQKKSETIKRDNEINAKVERIPGNFSNFDIPKNSTDDSYSDFLKNVSQRIGDPMQAHKEMNIQENIILAEIGAKFFNSLSTLVAHVICLPQYSSPSRKSCYDIFDPTSKVEDESKKSALGHLLETHYGISSKEALAYERNAFVVAENMTVDTLGGFAISKAIGTLAKLTAANATKTLVKSSSEPIKSIILPISENIPRIIQKRTRTPLIPEDIGIPTKVFEDVFGELSIERKLAGSVRLKRKTLKVKANDILFDKGELLYCTKAIAHLKELAKYNNADILHVEGWIVNPKLARVMEKLYGKPQIKVRNINQKWSIFKIPVRD